MSAVIENHHDDHHHGPAKGLTRWLYTTNHKDIGTLYLWFSFAMFLIGGAMAMIIRAELFQPGMQIVEPEFYNQMITLHGLIMIFGGVMPAFVGLANWLVPMMIGAPDMALPRMNNLSFWILPFAFFILLSSLFLEGGGSKLWMDLLCPTFYNICTSERNLLYIFSSYHGSLFYYGRYKRDSNNHEHESTRNGFDENAFIRLVLANNSLPANSCYACFSRRRNNDVDGYSFRHKFL